MLGSRVCSLGIPIAAALNLEEVIFTDNRNHYIKSDDCIIWVFLT